MSGSESLSGAAYTASYSYDTLDRLTSASVVNSGGATLTGAAQGSYTYGASGHLHAVSAIGSGATGYSAGYDAAGDMTCRGLGGATCAGASPSGQQLTSNTRRELVNWQNTPSAATAWSPRWRWRAHLVAVNGASEAAPVQPIPPEHAILAPSHGGAGGYVRAIEGIEELFDACARERALPHALELAGWIVAGSSRAARVPPLRPSA